MESAKRKWLSLTDYASKYRVSVSTLRRRIKSEQIEHRTEHGRYLIPDRPLKQIEIDEETSSPIPSPALRESLRFIEQDESFTGAADQTDEAQTGFQPPERGATAAESPRPGRPGEMDFLTAKSLVDELKKAYANVLHEKEEQIISLKSEVTDLKTLVRALESENQRLRTLIQRKPPLATQ